MKNLSKCQEMIILQWETILRLFAISSYKLIGVDSPRQTNTSTSQQINFVGKLEEDDAQQCYL